MPANQLPLWPLAPQQTSQGGPPFRPLIRSSSERTFVKRYLSLFHQDWAPCLPRVAQDVVRDKIPFAPPVSSHGKASDLRPGVGLGQRCRWLLSATSAGCFFIEPGKRHFQTQESGIVSVVLSSQRTSSFLEGVIFLHRSRQGNWSHLLLLGCEVG